MEQARAIEGTLNTLYFNEKTSVYDADREIPTLGSTDNAGKL